MTAVYENPDGESEPVGDIVALGTRPTPYNLTADRSEDGTLNLAWTAPKPSENAVEKYVVFRGNDKIGETTATTLSEAKRTGGKLRLQREGSLCRRIPFRAGYNTGGIWRKA